MTPWLIEYRSIEVTAPSTSTRHTTLSCAVVRTAAEPAGGPACPLMPPTRRPCYGVGLPRILLFQGPTMLGGPGCAAFSLCR